MQALTKYDAARYALSVAVEVDEVKDIRDKAEAMAAYARQAKDTELVQWATEIKVRAERRAGQMLAEMPKQDGGHAAKAKARSHDGTEVPKSLADIGITKNESSRWQKLAAVTDTQFEQAVSAAKEVAGEVTTAAMLRAAKACEPPKPVAPRPTPAPVAEPEEPSLADQVREETGAGDFDAAASEVQELRSGYLLVAEENQRLLDENAALKADGTTEEQDAAQALISELRETNRIQGLELDAVKVSRDIYLNENAQLKKQIKFYQRKLKELEA